MAVGHQLWEAQFLTSAGEAQICLKIVIIYLNSVSLPVIPVRDGAQPKCAVLVLPPDGRHPAHLYVLGALRPPGFRPLHRGTITVFASYVYPSQYFFFLIKLIFFLLCAFVFQVPNTPGIITSLIRFYLFWKFGSSHQGSTSYKPMPIWGRGGGMERALRAAVLRPFLCWVRWLGTQPMRESRFLHSWGSKSALVGFYTTCVSFQSAFSSLPLKISSICWSTMLSSLCTGGTGLKPDFLFSQRIWGVKTFWLFFSSWLTCLYCYYHVFMCSSSFDEEKNLYNLMRRHLCSVTTGVLLRQHATFCFFNGECIFLWTVQSEIIIAILYKLLHMASNKGKGNYFICFKLLWWFVVDPLVSVLKHIIQYVTFHDFYSVCMGT